MMDWEDSILLWGEIWPHQQIKAAQEELSFYSEDSEEVVDTWGITPVCYSHVELVDLISGIQSGEFPIRWFMSTSYLKMFESAYRFHLGLRLQEFSKGFGIEPVADEMFPHEWVHFILDDSWALE